jgi:hypothetical protein
LIAVVVFEVKIGFDELDYQFHVAKNNPEHVSEFHDHSITEALDEMITNPSLRLKRYFKSSLYPTEPIPLRAELKEKIQSELSNGSWPWWFAVPEELDYQAKKESLLNQYNLFIAKRPNSRRMAIALYYKALLSEYSPDVNLLGQKEKLQFYSDYPFDQPQDIWEWLYTEFDNNPESLEARWRLAKHRAGDKEFKQADDLLAKAQTMLEAERSKLLEAEQAPSGGLFSLFRPPADSAMTVPKLNELQRRLNQLRVLISSENRTDEPGSIERLAKFVMLNPHAPDYAQHLVGLFEQTEDGDRLRDNILLAQAKLVADEQLRAEKLSELHKQYDQTDGGMLALYELGLLKISLWRQKDESDSELKKEYLNEARATLTSFVGSYPNSFYAEQVKKNLDGLPTAE